MTSIYKFDSKFDKGSVLEILRRETTASKDLQPFIFSKTYFSGVVESNMVRIRNASRHPRNLSPILQLNIAELAGICRIEIFDDTEDELIASSTIYKTMGIILCFLVLLIGGIS